MLLYPKQHYTSPFMDTPSMCIKSSSQEMRKNEPIPKYEPGFCNLPPGITTRCIP